MSDDRQNSSVNKKAVRILTLGMAGGLRSVIEALNQSGEGEGLSWTELAKPDNDLANLVRAGSQADVVIVGFESGTTPLDTIQRWVWLASELGVPHVVLTVESGRLPPQGHAGFDALMRPMMVFMKDRCDFQTVTTVPINTATAGNVVARDANLGWYSGPTLRTHLRDCAEAARGAQDHLQPTEPIQSDHIQARLFWVDDAALLPWRPLQLRTDQSQREATVTSIKYERDPHAVERIARNRLHKGDVGVCNINITEAFKCVPFAQDRQAGLFTLADPETHNIVALGLIDYSLRRASNIRWQETTVTSDERARAKQQKASVLWFTGLSGAGKSTIADLVEKRLTAAGRHTMLLDGDNVRHGLNKDLGFTDVDRVENIRRISEVSKLMCDAGLIVLVSFISPFRAERQLARETVERHNFMRSMLQHRLRLPNTAMLKGCTPRRGRARSKILQALIVPMRCRLILR